MSLKGRLHFRDIKLTLYVIANYYKLYSYLDGVSFMEYIASIVENI